MSLREFVNRLNGWLELDQFSDLEFVLREDAGHQKVPLPLYSISVSGDKDKHNKVTINLYKEHPAT